MGNLQVWGTTDEEAFEEVDNEFKKSGGSEFIKLSVGKNVLRFLPALPGKNAHFKIIQEHFVEQNIGGEQSTLRFVCPRATAKQRCPVCDEADALLRTGNVVDRKAAKKMYPSLRVYFNVINRKAPEEGPKIFTCGKTIWEQLKGIKDDKQDGGEYWNPGADGFDIVINRTGTGKNDTEYKVLVARNNSPLHKDPKQVAEWAEKAFNLDMYAVLMDPGELLDALSGGSSKRQGRGSLRDGGGGGSTRALPAGNNKRSSKRTAQDDAEGETIDAEYDEVADEEDDVPL